MRSRSAYRLFPICAVVLLPLVMGAREVLRPAPALAVEIIPEIANGDPDQPTSGAPEEKDWQGTSPGNDGGGKGREGQMAATIARDARPVAPAPVTYRNQLPSLRLVGLYARILVPAFR